MPRTTVDLATWIEELEKQIVLLRKELRKETQDIRWRLKLPPME